MPLPPVAGYAVVSAALLLAVGWLATATGRAARRRLRRLRAECERRTDHGAPGYRTDHGAPGYRTGHGAPGRRTDHGAGSAAPDRRNVPGADPPGTAGTARVTELREDPAAIPPRANTVPSGWWRPDRVRLAAASIGLSAAVLLGGLFGCLAGAALAVGVDRSVRRFEPADTRRRRRGEAADLSLAADLIAAALRAGAPVDRAVTAVAEAVGGPLAERIHRVGRTLRLGGEPEEAWAHLDGVDGGQRVARAAVRSSASGASLAGTLFRIADDLRTDRAVAAEAAARRSGVLIVLPLGLCFLPAFILAGLVPVIVAVLGDVL